VTAPLARAAAEADTINLDDLDDERRGWTAGELLAALDTRLPDVRDREVPVVTHGDWCLPNVVFDTDTVEVVGLLDTGRAGRAYRFLNRYGHQSADDDKLAFYRLLDEFF
jgi:aminoglycoside phosphotransferase